MCIELAQDALENGDLAKAEKFYKKATKLDFDLNVDELMLPVIEAREREKAAKEKYKEAESEIERIKKADKNDGVQSALKVRDRRLMLSNLGLF